MLSNLVPVVALLGQAAVLFVFVRMLPSALNRFVSKAIDRWSDEKLERAKAEIQGSYSTLKSSVEMLTATNSGLHPHITEAVSTLWKAMVVVRNLCSGLVTFDAAFLVQEAEVAFANQEQKVMMLAFVASFADEMYAINESQAVFGEEMERCRLFSGDRLWLLFYVHRAILLRGALLIAWSYKESKFRDWRKDVGTKVLLESALSQGDVQAMLVMETGGLNAALNQIEALFLHEATRVMSGSKAMSDSLANMQAIMQLENARVATKGQ